MNIQIIVDKLNEIDYSEVDIDEFLDARESKLFESEWLNIYKQIAKERIPLEIKGQADECRKKVFLMIDAMTGGSELSEYISEDMELLIFADYLGITNAWFKNFIEKYENGELPTGTF